MRKERRVAKKVSKALNIGQRVGKKMIKLSGMKKKKYDVQRVPYGAPVTADWRPNRYREYLDSSGNVMYSRRG